MKNILLSVALLLSALHLWSQTDQPTYGYNYLAVVRTGNTLNSPVAANQSVTLRFQVFNATNQKLYEETHDTVVTDNFGRASAVVGAGTPVTGTFSALNWAGGKHFLQVRVKIGAGSEVDLGGKEEFVHQPLAKGSGDWKNVGDTMLLAPDIRVGIGTNDVFGTFQVVNPQNSTDLVIGDGSSGSTYIRMSTSAFSGGYGEIQAAKKAGANWGDLILNPKGGNVVIGKEDPNLELQVKGSITAGSRIYPGYTGTEDGYSLIHFKNGTAAHGGIIRASQGNGDGGDAPLIFQASNFLFDSDVHVNGIFHTDEQAFIGTPTTSTNSKLVIGGETRLEENGKTRLALFGQTGNLWQGGIFILDNNGVPSVSKVSLVVESNGTGRVQADNVVASIKNFRMAYPGKQNEEIWYACIEGPEAAAYERGTIELVNGSATVVLSEHFRAVMNASTMTVQVVPLSAESEGLAVVEKNENGFKVKELHRGSGTYKIDWEVKAVRKGYEKYQVVRKTGPSTSSLPIPSRGEEAPAILGF